MNVFTVVVAYLVLLQHWLCLGMPLSTRGPIDDIIQMQLLQFTKGTALADGLVLAGTIVEGGPVFGRSRKILGGRTVHPGLEYLDFGLRIERCPTLTFGYKCLDWVQPECEVTRHLLVDNSVCTCKVDVC